MLDTNPGNESVLQRFILFTITYKTNEPTQIKLEGKKKKQTIRKRDMAKLLFVIESLENVKYLWPKSI